MLAVCTLKDNFQVDIPAIDFLALHARSGDKCATAKGFKGLFDRYANAGFQQLTTDLLHEVDKTEKIYEFIRGDLRIFCFFDGEKVILSHGAVKKGQKVDQQEVARAIANKNEYFN